MLHDPSRHAQGLQTGPQYIFDHPSSADISVTFTLPLSNLLDLDSADTHRRIYEQAASFLNVSYPYLLNQRHRHHEQKRQRLNSDASLPMPYHGSPITQGSEKPTPSSQVARDEGRRFPQLDGLPSWTNSRLADCLAGFTACAPCTTYEPQPGKSFPEGLYCLSTELVLGSSSRTSKLTGHPVLLQGDQHPWMCRCSVVIANNPY